MERGIITISEIGMVTIPTDPVWMTMQEMADLFMVFCCDIHKAIRDIYKNHELLEETTMCYIRQEDGTRYEVYSLEMVIALAFSYVAGNVWLSECSLWKGCMPPIGKSPFICSFHCPKPIHDTNVNVVCIYNDNNARSRWPGNLPVAIGFCSFHTLQNYVSVR